MDMSWSPDDRKFQQSARTWLEKHVPRTPRPEDETEARDFDLRWQQAQFRGGWAGIHWPKSHGGQGLSPLKQFIWHQECARAGAPDIGVCFVGNNHAGPILIDHGDPQQQAHLANILSGSEVWCQGFSEPHAGSDLAAIRTSGTIDGDTLVICGEKLWSSYAQHADYQELLVRTDPDSQRQRGLSWVICDMRTPGIRVRPIRQLDGRPEFCSITYDEVRIPIRNVVGGLGNGWSVAMSTLSLERGAGFIIDQERLAHRIEELIQLAVERDANALVFEELGMLRAEISSLQAFSLKNILRSESGENLGAEGSITKVLLSMLTQKASRLSMDILGADSLARTRSGAKWIDRYLRSYQTSLGAGTNEIQLEVVAERLLDLPRGR
jgi:alkylation response protein AidB-like acyl-CoA dehydrogenase